MVRPCPDHLRRIIFNMWKAYKTVSEIFSSEVEMELETKYTMISRIDVPMYVFIQYGKEDDIWYCKCQFEPLTGKKVTIVREYSTELVSAAIELEGKLC